ncbi:hypothetical protein [Actinocorallia lasiicapitis]
MGLLLVVGLGVAVAVGGRSGDQPAAGPTPTASRPGTGTPSQPAYTYLEDGKPILVLRALKAWPGEHVVASIKPTAGNRTLVTRSVRPGTLVVRFDCMGAGKLSYEVTEGIGAGPQGGSQVCVDTNAAPTMNVWENMLEQQGGLAVKVTAAPGVRWTMMISYCPKRGDC